MQDLFTGCNPYISLLEAIFPRPSHLQMQMCGFMVNVLCRESFRSVRLANSRRVSCACFAARRNFGGSQNAVVGCSA